MGYVEVPWRLFLSDQEKPETGRRGREGFAKDADDTDVDLYVTDPLGDQASYSRRATHQGGNLSPDAPGGYGPEEFSLKTTAPGAYQVTARFHSHRQPVLSEGTTLMLRISTGFGTPAWKDGYTTVRVTGSGQTVRVGDIKVNERLPPAVPEAHGTQSKACRN